MGAGVNLYIQSTPKYKRTSVYVYLHQPLRRETVTANALLSMVLRRASADYPTTAALQRHLDELYGAELSADVSRRGEVQSIVFRLTLANEKFIPGARGLLEAGLDTLAGTVLRPHFNSDYVAQEAANLRQVIEGLINDKQRYAFQRCIEEQCNGEPFALFRYGIAADLDGMTAGRLQAHYEQVLARSLVDVFCIGDVEEAQAVELIGRTLRFPVGAQRERSATQVLRAPAAPLRRVEERHDVNQGWLVIGGRSGTTVADGAYFPLRVANAILGGYSHSKLFQNVRERASLAYSVHSVLETVKGTLHIIAGIDVNKADEAVEISLAQVRDLQAGAFTEEELEASVKGLVNDAYARQDQPGYLVESYLEGLAGGKEISQDDRIAGYQAVTREQVVAVAQGFQPELIFFLTGKGGT